MVKRDELFFYYLLCIHGLPCVLYQAKKNIRRKQQSRRNYVSSVVWIKNFWIQTLQYPKKKFYCICFLDKYLMLMEAFFFLQTLVLNNIHLHLFVWWPLLLFFLSFNRDEGSLLIWIASVTANIPCFLTNVIISCAYTEEKTQRSNGWQLNICMSRCIIWFKFFALFVSHIFYIYCAIKTKKNSPKKLIRFTFFCCFEFNLLLYSSIRFLFFLFFFASLAFIFFEKCVNNKWTNLHFSTIQNIF